MLLSAHILLLLSFSCFQLSSAVFNYQVSARVSDKVSDFTYLIAKVLNLPLQKMNRYLVNISQPYDACNNLFFVEMVTFIQEVASLYMGMENGLFLDYETNAQNIIFGMNAVGKTIKMKYEVSADGFPSRMIGNATYNVRGRGWYITAKQLKKNYWTAPYIDAASGDPVISLIYPLVNYTLGGVRLPYAGSVCADVYLTQISNYLVQSYRNTNQMVFIVDKGTLSILGNSFGAMTYTVNPASPTKKVSALLTLLIKDILISI